MKKTIQFLAIFAIAAVAAFANAQGLITPNIAADLSMAACVGMISQTVAQELQTIALVPMADITASADGTGIDVTDYVGSIAVVLSAKNVAGTSPTLIVKLQDSADNSTFADITGAVFTTVTAAGTKASTLQKINVNIDGAAKYIRAVQTIGGTDAPEFLLSCTGLGVKQYRS